MRVLLIFVFCVIASQASAQYYDKMFFISWNANQPLSNSDFAGKFSSRGARVGYRELLNEKFTFGVDLTWSTYDDYIDRQTYQMPGGAITTDYVNYANVYGATLAGEYYFLTEQRIMPYVGFGAGIGYHNYKAYYNVFSSGDNAFGLLLRPQAGCWFKFSERKSWAVNTAVHFDFSTARSADFGYNNFASAGFQIGLVYLDW
jgi:hypothetical protein